jgi:hypothetical protein
MKHVVSLEVDPGHWQPVLLRDSRDYTALRDAATLRKRRDLQTQPPSFYFYTADMKAIKVSNAQELALALHLRPDQPHYSHRNLKLHVRQPAQKRTSGNKEESQNLTPNIVHPQYVNEPPPTASHAIEKHRIAPSGHPDQEKEEISRVVDRKHWIPRVHRIRPEHQRSSDPLQAIASGRFTSMESLVSFLKSAIAVSSSHFQRPAQVHLPGLTAALSQIRWESREYILSSLIPWIAQTAMADRSGPPQLLPGQTYLRLERKRILSLLCNAFLCRFPEQDTSPHFTFQHIFQNGAELDSNACSQF